LEFNKIRDKNNHLDFIYFKFFFSSILVNKNKLHFEFIFHDYLIQTGSINDQLIFTFDGPNGKNQPVVNKSNLIIEKFCSLVS